MVQWGLTAFCNQDELNEIPQDQIKKPISFEPSEAFLIQPQIQVPMAQILCGKNFAASISVFG